MEQQRRKQKRDNARVFDVPTLTHFQRTDLLFPSVVISVSMPNTVLVLVHLKL
jgi:hypothetical protein